MHTHLEEGRHRTDGRNASAALVKLWHSPASASPVLPDRRRRCCLLLRLLFVIVCILKPPGGALPHQLLDIAHAQRRSGGPRQHLILVVKHAALALFVVLVCRRKTGGEAQAQAQAGRQCGAESSSGSK